MSLIGRIVDFNSLKGAFLKIKSSTLARGYDNISADDFEKNINDNINKIMQEIISGSYEPKPIVVFNKEDDAKERKLGIMCISDKVIQQSINFNIRGLFERYFSNSIYAYRQGRSAVMAVDVVNDYIITGSFHYLYADIENFFDNIDHGKLMLILSKRIFEKEVLDLISKCIKSPKYENGVIIKNEVGICQGSIIAPLLSNIYLNDFDLLIEKSSNFYIRYSDDILVLDSDTHNLEYTKNRINIELNNLNLSLNSDKTKIGSIKDGLTFLGYNFDASGKHISQKAETSLEKKLEGAFNKNPSLNIEDKIKDLEDVFRGWKQYYKSDSYNVGNFYEYLIYLYEADKNNDKDEITRLVNLRPKFIINTKIILKYLAEVWIKHEKKEIAIDECERYNDLITGYIRKNAVVDAHFELWKSFMNSPLDKNITEDLIQFYTDNSIYRNAQLLMEKLDESQKETSEIKEGFNKANLKKSVDIDLQKFYELFVAREDIYSKDEVDANNKRYYIDVLSPLTLEVLETHIKGIQTIATFIRRPNNTVKFLVIDIDISKGRILKMDKDKDFDVYLSMTHEVAAKIVDFASNYGLVSYIEDSGCRGRHVWVLFDQWISVDKAYTLAKFLTSECSANDDINIEIFPNGIRSKQFGQIIKLPLGIHTRTKRRSCFLTKDGFIYDDEKSFIDSMVKNDVNIVNKIITTQCNSLNKIVPVPNIDRDIAEITSDNNLIWSVLNGCSIIRYLCFKAKDTAYLTHGERQTLLYVFGHIGDEGRSFLHSIMGLTLNYNYGVTEKFINKIPAKPISCIKIRDQYKDLTAGLGCNCSFKLVKNSYPSPVLHALKEKDDNKITLPVSLIDDDLTVEDKKTFEDKLNVPKQTEEFIANLIELKKKKRSIEKEIGACENQLNQIFDSLKIDSLEASIGTLVRKRKDNKIYWNLEL